MFIKFFSVIHNFSKLPKFTTFQLPFILFEIKPENDPLEGHFLYAKKLDNIGPWMCPCLIQKDRCITFNLIFDFLEGFILPVHLACYKPI